jgi:HEAT repeat protein
MPGVLIAPVSVQDRPSIEQSLSALFDAERTVRRLHDELARQPEAALLATLTGAISSALQEKDDDEAGLRLVRISSLLGELEGAGVVDALIDILTSENPEARSHAGEVLESLAFDRFKDVARGVERALKRLPVGSPALPELPYILVEIPEPGVIKLLGQFLKHGDADAVAAAIEALVQVGDPNAAGMIEPLVDDMRTVELDEDGSDGSTELTLGELAEEALEILSGGEGDEDEPAGGRGLPS